jgi:two-component system sensor histidine kinase KdpD
VNSTDATFYSDPEQILVSSAEMRSAQSDNEEVVLSRDDVRFIQLRLGMRHPVGRLAVAGGELTHEMSEAIGSMVSVALERAAALERSSRLEAARESERLRSALVDSVTHDLRTPLTAIRAAATTLQNQPSIGEEERNDLIAVVEEESARLDRLIGQAMEMATLDSQSLRLELRPVNVRELIELTVERTLGMQKHPVDIQLSEEFPDVNADRNLLERVLRHLLENASAYSRPGDPIAVSARIEGNRVFFTVADRGLGIDSEDLPFVFDKYFRGKGNKNRTKGTGMGLAIARAIMKIHQGGIAAESHPGEGSQFTFWIPLSLVPAATDSSSPRDVDPPRQQPMTG